MGFRKWLEMGTLLENISHLCVESQAIVLNEAPHGPLVGPVPEPMQASLGSERQYFIDLGFDDWPVTPELRTALLKDFASVGVGIPGTEYIIRAPYTLAITIESGTATATMRNDWLSFAQLLDFHRKEDPVVWFGRNVRPDRRAKDFATNPERFEKEELGWRRIGG